MSVTYVVVLLPPPLSLSLFVAQVKCVIFSFSANVVRFAFVIPLQWVEHFVCGAAAATPRRSFVRRLEACVSWLPVAAIRALMCQAQP